MDPATVWWLHHTATGRRVLERSMPLGSIPAPTRRKICVDRGHDPFRGVCRRCGERIPS